MKRSDIELGFAATKVEGKKRVIVITGANAGLGRETARRLLLAGMRVVCACRSEKKGKLAATELLAETVDRPDPSIDDALFMQLDVSSLQSVRSFIEHYKRSGLPLHALLCNAGIMMGPRRTSVDGIELQLATNYLGHFELCRGLTDQLIASAPSRVVHVSSVAAHRGRIPLDNLNASADNYDSRSVYSMTKLLQVIFSRALNRRLEPAGVTSNSIEPGVVATNLSAGITDNAAMRRRLEQGISVEEGASTQILLCGAQQLHGRGGGHWAEGQEITHRFAKFGAPSLSPLDLEQAIWKASEALVQAYTENTH